MNQTHHTGIAVGLFDATTVTLPPATSPTPLAAGDSYQLGRTNLGDRLLEAMAAPTLVSIVRGEGSRAVEFGISSVSPSSLKSGQLTLWIQLAPSSDLQLGNLHDTRCFLEYDVVTGETELMVSRVGNARVTKIEPDSQDTPGGENDVMCTVEFENRTDFWATDSGRYEEGDFVLVRVAEDRDYDHLVAI